MPGRLDPVHRELARFLRGEGVTRTARVLAAVSGGPDSVALLHALVSLGQRVGVAHVHHGLRGAEADREADFVAELSHRLGVPFHAERVDARRRDGRSPEARARALRYEALERMRDAGGYASIATAHHMDDQAETVLLRAARGTGLAGLAAIRPALDGGRVLRPLLGLRRAELREYLARRGLAWCTDSSNAEWIVPRNRLRAEVLPALESLAPGAVAHLAELAARAREADDAARPELEAWLARAAEPGEGGVWLECAPLLSLDPARRRRALAELAGRAELGERITRAQLVRIEAFVAGARAGARLSLTGTRSLYRDRARVWLGPASGPHFPPPVRRALAAGDSLEFPERGLRLSWVDARSSPAVAALDRFPVAPADACTVRSACDGDLVRVRGRERRLAEVFAGARWARRERARALVIERCGEIVWVPGLWAAHGAPAAEVSCEIRAERLSSPRFTC
ncbi:MAG TPA: tRNA lysidine(34) synthetase TilS [Myxococcota bacterium]|nr:tRNA lysidine(34) synthetase TilS [Myxococcota bacterium]